MRLWLDDIRPEPDPSWIWVKTVEEAQELLLRWGSELTIASLDHDLGEVVDPNWDGDPREPMELTWDQYCDRPPREEGDGIDLAHWMARQGIYPSEQIIIHSWNERGAENMAYALKDSPVPVIVKSFEVPRGIDALRFTLADSAARVQLMAENRRRFNEGI